MNLVAGLHLADWRRLEWSSTAGAVSQHEPGCHVHLPQLHRRAPLPALPPPVPRPPDAGTVRFSRTCARYTADSDTLDEVELDGGDGLPRACRARASVSVRRCGACRSEDVEVTMSTISGLRPSPMTRSSPCQGHQPILVTRLSAATAACTPSAGRSASARPATLDAVTSGNTQPALYGHRREGCLAAALFGESMTSLVTPWGDALGEWSGQR